MNFPLNQIGAACVYFARTSQQIEPAWNQELEFTSGGIKETDLLKCFELLKEKYKVENKKEELRRTPV